MLIPVFRVYIIAGYRGTIVEEFHWGGRLSHLQLPIHVQKARITMNTCKNLPESVFSDLYTTKEHFTLGQLIIE